MHTVAGAGLLGAYGSDLGRGAGVSVVAGMDARTDMPEREGARVNATLAGVGR
jgi:hypothetical protein